MRLKEVIAAATAVRINGHLAGNIELWGKHAFQATWINGASHTYTDAQVNAAKFNNGAYIIDNDVVEFYVLTPLPAEYGQ